MSAAAPPILRVEDLSKRFADVWANRAISFDVARGEVHCLLGENGAGKTTLSECLYGTYRPDSGAIHFKDHLLDLGSPRDAIQAGIGMVHQHFVLAPPLTVLENIVVGTDLPFVLDFAVLERRLESLCTSYGLDLDLRATIRQLSVGERQWVEILKALYVGVDLLILDEPTATLTPMEVGKLFEIINTMKANGLSVIFITHKLDEVMEVSDRVTTLRKGAVVATQWTADVDKPALARMMIGRDVKFRLDKPVVTTGSPVIEVRDLHVDGDRGVESLRGVAFTVREREILGLAGVSGNGQRELFEVLVGTRRASRGSVEIVGKDMLHASPRSLIELGVGSVPEDRLEEGLIMEFEIYENVALGLHHDRPFSRMGILNEQQMLAVARRSIDEYAIDTPSARRITALLSGGNLQKVILARELLRDPRCLIVSQPTRGLDVGSAQYVHERLLAQRERGAGLLLISEDLDEVFNLSDRIAVIFKGQIAAVLDTASATPHDVGLLMAGVPSAATSALEIT
jgi:simple sugar transport system ATP-binding protein